MRVQLTDHTQETTQEAHNRMLSEYRGTITKCKTIYNAKDKGVGYKDKTGDSVSTGMTPIIIYTNEKGIECSEEEGVPTSIQWRALSWEHTMLLHEKILYNKLMKLDPKYIRVLAKVKKHIKRKTRAVSNKDNTSKNGKERKGTYKRREAPTIPLSKV